MSITVQNPNRKEKVMDTQNENKTEIPKEAKAPDYRLSFIRETQHGDQWANIGVGWVHKDGQGISYKSDLLKLYGIKLVARKIERS